MDRSREETRKERNLAQAQLIAMERQQAAEAERAAIARELHDIVSHSVSMIAVQAESATYTTPGLTPEARDGFQQIAGTARSSMAELRRLLGVLRTPAGDPAFTAPPADPRPSRRTGRAAPGGGRQGRAESHRGAGVAARRVGAVHAYRITQEALTNARKHAPGARTVVEIDYGADRLLTLRIHDDGPGPEGSGPGFGACHGLTGMRERAAPVRRSAQRGRRPGRRFPGGGGASLGDRVIDMEKELGVIRAVVADDQAVVRTGFVNLLNTQEDIEVVGEAEDGVQAVRIAAETRPDLALLDIRMPHKNGIEAAREILAGSGSTTKVLMLTTSASTSTCTTRSRPARGGFLLKDATFPELLHAVRVVAAGNALLSPKITKRVIGEFVHARASRLRVHSVAGGTHGA